MATADIIDSDIADTDGDELIISIAENREISVTRIVRMSLTYGEQLLTLTPDAAHELGNKLRLAAKKARA